jgi:hypothetical protein
MNFPQDWPACHSDGKKSGCGRERPQWRSVNPGGLRTKHLAPVGYSCSPRPGLPGRGEQRGEVTIAKWLEGNTGGADLPVCRPSGPDKKGCPTQGKRPPVWSGSPKPGCSAISLSFFMSQLDIHVSMKYPWSYLHAPTRDVIASSISLGSTTLHAVLRVQHCWPPRLPPRLPILSGYFPSGIPRRVKGFVVFIPLMVMPAFS